MARCELLSHVRHPSRPAPVVTLSLPAALFQQLYVSQTSKPRTKEGEKDDRSASCLCVLCAALCGAVARANITAEDDEIQVELTNETSVVSVCALSNLLSGVSVSSGSLYRGCEQSAIHRQLHGESDQRWTEEGSGCDRARAGRRQPACRLGGGRR
ncbi:hypothetical protein ERJ75_000105200 [Trypanosoma vivax]|nr:hypothetical protein ERJ75_000105200 [Trypanosoma vivax]